jgi:hypothetical protein
VSVVPAQDERGRSVSDGKSSARRDGSRCALIRLSEAAWRYSPQSAAPRLVSNFAADQPPAGCRSDCRPRGGRGQTSPRAPSHVTTSTTRHFTSFGCILKGWAGFCKLATCFSKQITNKDQTNNKQITNKQNHSSGVANVADGNS